MSELDAQIPIAFNPSAEANIDDLGSGSKEYVHIRIQQKNGRKNITNIQGLKIEFKYNKICKDVKKVVIQLEGDQRKNVSTFLIQAGIVKKENIKIHGLVSKKLESS